MDTGVLLSDFPKSWGPRRQFSELLRQVEAAQRNGFRYLCLGQHFLYGDYTCLQPIPTFARRETTWMRNSTVPSSSRFQTA